MASYIPQKDSLLQNWLNNFQTLIAAAPATYGLVAADSTAITAAYNAWNTAFAAAVNPATRTPQTVAAKDTAKVNALGIIRPYAQRIAKNAGLSPATKIAVGVNPGTNPPGPIPAPTTYPVLSIPTALAQAHVVYYRDQLASPSVKSKPPGVVSCELHAWVGTTPAAPADITQWPVIKVMTKSPTTITWSSQPSGTFVAYAARWVTRKGLYGPFGAVVTKAITT